MSTSSSIYISDGVLNLLRNQESSYKKTRDFKILQHLVTNFFFTNLIQN